MHLQAGTARAGCCKAEQRMQPLYEGLPNPGGPRACKLGSAASIKASAAAARDLTTTSCCAAATWRDAGSFGVQQVLPSCLPALVYESVTLRAVARLSSRCVMAPQPRVSGLSMHGRQPGCRPVCRTPAVLLHPWPMLSARGLFAE